MGPARGLPPQADARLLLSHHPCAEGRIMCSPTIASGLNPLHRHRICGSHVRQCHFVLGHTWKDNPYATLEQGVVPRRYRLESRAWK